MRSRRWRSSSRATAPFAASELGLGLTAVPHIERGYSLYFLALCAVVDAEAPRLRKVERFAQLFEELDRVDKQRALRLADRLCDALTRAPLPPP